MDSKKPFPTLKLNSGFEIPLVGLGTFDSKSEEKMTDILRNAFSNKKIELRL
jgi:diketogulonate reductase-like aldo/keto reductase